MCVIFLYVHGVYIMYVDMYVYVMYIYIYECICMCVCINLYDVCVYIVDV